MALRRIAPAQNTENNPHLIGKSNIEPSALNTKRNAFGDVGNKLTDTDRAQTNALSKPNATTKPQGRVYLKKPVISQPVKRESVNADPTKKAVKKESTHTITSYDPTKKKTIVRQESIRNIPAATKLAGIKKLSLNTKNSPATDDIIDPDEKIKNEPRMVPEYLMDIFVYLREREVLYTIEEKYLDGHESTPAMRSILVNWLVEVHQNFKFEPETLYICMSLVDRYLQANRKVGKSTLQLVGASAMFLASKYEEIYAPDLEDFEYICDNTFTKRQILQMEKEILKKIDFNMGAPLSIRFLRRFSKIAQARLEHHTLGKYLLELALLDYEMCSIRPSIQASAACCLSLGVMNEVMDLSKLWTPTMVYYSSYTYSDIKPTIIKFARLLVSSEKSKHQAVRKKYSGSRYMKISIDSKLNGPIIRRLTVGYK